MNNNPGFVTSSEPTELEATIEQRARTAISPKVSGGALAGALGVIATFVLSQYGVEIPAGVEAAGVVVLTAIVGYLIPDRS